MPRNKGAKSDMKAMLGWRLLDVPGEWSTLAKAVVTEYCCTAMFLFIATLVVTSGCHTQDTANATDGGNTTLSTAAPGSCFLGTTNLINIAFGFGLSIFVLVYVAASFSGGHLNPAVSLGLFVGRRISLLRCFVYILAQMAGAATGSAIAKGIDPDGYCASLGATNRLAAGYTLARGWGVECILTLALVFVVFAATDTHRATMAAHLPVLAPFTIGITVFLCHLVAVPIDGCSVNPARSFGASAASHVWTNQWVFWVGPLSGAIIAGLAYEFIFRSDPNEVVVPKHLTDVEQGSNTEAPVARLPGYTGTRGMREVKPMSDSTHGHATAKSPEE